MSLIFNQFLDPHEFSVSYTIYFIREDWFKKRYCIFHVPLTPHLYFITSDYYFKKAGQESNYSETEEMSYITIQSQKGMSFLKLNPELVPFK